jgi:hypothetical protein
MIHQSRQEWNIVPDPVNGKGVSARACAAMASARVGACVTNLAIIGS